jgi:hypothetical protein
MRPLTAKKKKKKKKEKEKGNPVAMGRFSCNLILSALRLHQRGGKGI